MVPTITRMFGVEMEFFLINKQGRMVNKADHIIRAIRNELRDTTVAQECGKSMIELVTFPHRSSRAVFGTFLNDFETFLYELDVNDLGLAYYGTYPGKTTTKMRQDKRYTGKAQILGERQWPQAGRCIGFHFHYSLPRKSFNKKMKFFYIDIRKQKKDKILNLYNLYVALDPALSTLMQSSPYFEGQYLGKDSRMIVYRGEPLFDFNESLYANRPEYGTLNEYEKDFPSLVSSIRNRADMWRELLQEHDLTFRDFAKKEASLLDSSWKPVKISTHGTIESRGADMNSLSNVVAMSSLMKSLSKYVQDNKIEIVPSRTGNSKPFKLEGKKMYVPRYDKLLELQKYSALEGLDNSDVHAYTESLLRTIRRITRIESQAPLRPFLKMVEEKKTVSDEIVDFVRERQGYTDTIEPETVDELMKKKSQEIYRDLVITKKMSEKNLIFN